MGNTIRSKDSPIHGQGEMADLIRSLDWSQTALGPIEGWSETLIATVNMVLGCPLPMQLFWGPEFVVLYNDGLLPILTNKHPWALGQPARLVWAEAWDVVGPLMIGVRATAVPFYHNRHLVPIHRFGDVQDAYWDYSYSAICNPQSEVEGVIDIVRDVTETVHAEKARREAELALIQSEKLAAVGRLAASIAHEINNPLESVTNLLYLARNSEDLREAQEYLDTAERELRRVSVISNQTLRFYKQSSKPTAVTSKELFASVFSVYQGKLVNSHVGVFPGRYTEQPVRCFEGEIRQVLSNLVGNAIDAMHPAGGRLLVRSRKSRNHHTGQQGITMTVADTGPGMAPEVVARIFEAFYTTKGIAGNGLGLWVSRDIVERHQGALRVRSSQHDQRHGTVFTLFLPLEAASRFDGMDTEPLLR